jgi:drug/metabolite transporter (DMT)-like permease
MEKGIKLALLAALISGFSIFINKSAMGAIAPLTFTTSKNLVVGLAICSLILLSGKWRKIRDLKRHEVVKLVVVGVIGGSLPFYLFFTGLAQTSAVSAAIIQKTLVLWVALLAIPFLKERLSLLQVVGIAVLFYGNSLIGGFKGFNFGQGELMILGATILWAVETVVAKKVLDTVDVNLVTGARMGLGSLVLISFGGWPSISGSQVWGVVVTAGLLFAYVSVWYRALEFAPATVVTSVLVLSTLVTNVLSAKLAAQQMVIMLLGAGLFLSKLLWSKIQGLLAPAWLEP